MKTKEKIISFYSKNAIHHFDKAKNIAKNHRTNIHFHVKNHIAITKNYNALNTLPFALGVKNNALQ